jgi:hypothetical protein
VNIQENLRTLAAAEPSAAPFGFDEFVQRQAVARVRRRTAVLGVAGSIAALGVVSIMALVTQTSPQPSDVQIVQVAAPAEAEMPALVNLDQFDQTSALEDHIALLDAELSVARVQAASTQQLRQMEFAREQLNQSLQRVTYAHALLNL